MWNLLEIMESSIEEEAQEMLAAIETNTTIGNNRQLQNGSPSIA